MHAVRNLNLYGGDVYCSVRLGPENVFRTPAAHCFQSAVWEYGREILIPSLTETKIAFEVTQGSGIFGLDSCCGYATLMLNIVS